MDLLTLLGILVRRWVVVLPILGLCAVGAGLSLQRIEPTYAAHSSYSIVASPDPVAQTGAIGRSLPETAAILAEVVSSDDWRDRLAQQGARASYQITWDGTPPVLRVLAFSTSGALSVQTANAVIAGLEAELAERQAAEPGGGRVTVDVLSFPTQPVTVEGTEGAILEARGALLLIEDQPAVGSNPFTSLSNALGGVVAELSSSSSFADRVADSGLDAEYRVTPDVFGAPVVRVETTARSEAEAVAAIDVVGMALNEELRVRQTEAASPDGSFIRLEQVVTPRSNLVAAPRVRTVAAIGVLGLLLATTAAFVVEAIWGRTLATHPRDELIEDWSDLDLLEDLETEAQAGR